MDVHAHALPHAVDLCRPRPRRSLASQLQLGAHDQWDEGGPWLCKGLQGVALRHLLPVAPRVEPRARHRGMAKVAAGTNAGDVWIACGAGPAVKGDVYKGVW